MPKTIKIIVPKPRDKWKFSIANGSYIRSTAAEVFTVIERKLKGKSNGYSGTKSEGKTRVIVNYDQLHDETDKGWENEAESQDVSEVFYALTCFLEDYLKDDFREDRLRRYRGGE